MMKAPPQQSKIFIGTSGWIYPSWEGIFYPTGLAGKDKLTYYAKYFKTTEINYSFYHLPRPTTYQNWYDQTPNDFLFAVKASRFITHIKRLKGVREAWKIFLTNALCLRRKLGPILFQFPPSFKATQENVKRLEEFLKLTAKLSSRGSAIWRRRGIPTKIVQPSGDNQYKLRFATEFRHKSWCDKKIYDLLKKYNVAWVIADSPNYPKTEVATADFVYIRMHGSQILFGSKYTEDELNSLAQKIKNWLKKKLDVYVYFNNDAYGYATENALELKKILEIN